MSRKRILIVTVIGLVLVGSLLAFRIWTPALSADGACRHTMERTEGYGPWQARGSDPLVRTREGDMVLTFFDGFNTASCHARQYGPVWIVVGLGQTEVACSRGLGAGEAQECPRGTYGVIP